MAVARMSATSIPTIPNAPVKTRSRKLLASLEKGVTHPTWAAATRAFGQTLSTTNGGDVLLAYPQHWNYFWSAFLLIALVSSTYHLLKQTLGGGRLNVPDIGKVLSGLQRIDPDIQTKDQSEHCAHNNHVTVELQPPSGHWHNHRWDREQERNEDHNCVSNGRYTLSALFFLLHARDHAPSSGHMLSNRFIETFLSVGVAVSSACVVKEKIKRRPPEARNRSSVITKLLRTVSCMLGGYRFPNGSISSSLPTMTTGVCIPFPAAVCKESGMQSSFAWRKRTLRTRIEGWVGARIRKDRRTLQTDRQEARRENAGRETLALRRWVVLEASCG
jgi:hypothetical protein